MDASHASKRSREPSSAASSVLPGLGAVAADDVPNRFPRRDASLRSRRVMGMDGADCSSDSLEADCGLPSSSAGESDSAASPLERRF